MVAVALKECCFESRVLFIERGDGLILTLDLDEPGIKVEWRELLTEMLIEFGTGGPMEDATCMGEGPEKHERQIWGGVVGELENLFFSLLCHAIFGCFVLLLGVLEFGLVEIRFERDDSSSRPIGWGHGGLGVVQEKTDKDERWL